MNIHFHQIFLRVSKHEQGRLTLLSKRLHQSPALLHPNAKALKRYVG